MMKYITYLSRKKPVDSSVTNMLLFPVVTFSRVDPYGKTNAQGHYVK